MEQAPLPNPPTYFKVLKKPTRQEQSLCFLSHANNIQKAISQITAWSESMSEKRNHLTACLKHSNFLKVKDLVLGSFWGPLHIPKDAFTNTRKLYQSFPSQQNETEVYFTEEKRWIKDLKSPALPVKRRPAWWGQSKHKRNTSISSLATTNTDAPFISTIPTT